MPAPGAAGGGDGGGDGDPAEAEAEAGAEPLTYYIDPSVPAEWRGYMKTAVEAWRPAFQAAGLGDEAIRGEKLYVGTLFFFVKQVLVRWLVCLRACISLGSKLKPAWFSMGSGDSNKALKASEKGVLCSIVAPCTCFGVLCSRGVAGLRDRGVRQALVACATPTNVKRAGVMHAVEELVGEPRVANGRDKLGYRPVSNSNINPFLPLLSPHRAPPSRPDMLYPPIGSQRFCPMRKGGRRTTTRETSGTKTCFACDGAGDTGLAGPGGQHSYHSVHLQQAESYVASFSGVARRC